ncbi:MAG: c-type cytochrome [Ferruginibacter sp.]
MTVKFIKYYTCITLLALIIVSVIFYRLLPGYNYNTLKKNTTDNRWQPPDTSDLGYTTSDNLIRYGRSLIANTAFYLGPKGSITHLANGMNCSNCHRQAGTKLYSGNFALVASTYPKYRERSGRTESIEFRINECMERSMNGEKLDSQSTEMHAMVAYLKWVGKDITKGTKLPGTGVQELAYMARAADAVTGRQIFLNKCKSCHGENGQGQPAVDSTGYSYPPLWGAGSFNVSAGMYRITRLATYVKYNMPYQVDDDAPQLSDEEAWDVAAFINSQPRPQKIFKYDWPDINTKPVDYPFGPYSDNFSEQQHKYGPFTEIKKVKTAAQKKPL